MNHKKLTFSEVWTEPKFNVFGSLISTKHLGLFLLETIWESQLRANHPSPRWRFLNDLKNVSINNKKWKTP